MILSKPRSGGLGGTRLRAAVSYSQAGQNGVLREPVPTIAVQDTHGLRLTRADVDLRLRRGLGD